MALPQVAAPFDADAVELEAQHVELVRRVKVLSESIANDAPDLARHLDFLQEYAVAHFGLEEEHMRAARYPGLLRHQAEHDRFIEDLLELAQAFDQRGAEAFEHLDTEGWLTKWIQRHVGGTDAELTAWIKARGAS